MVLNFRIISWKEKISYQEAYDIYAKQADRDLGRHVGNSRFDCTLFTNEELTVEIVITQLFQKKAIIIYHGKKIHQ